ncbi:MAG: DUF192 domain-containing protein [bacterium]|nr:DUF192 domain-containing protein [bacterium]
MLKNILIILLALALLFGIYAWFYARSPSKIAKQNPTPAFSKAMMEIGGREISVEIADEPDEQVQGLSGREGLPENEGMLFVFDRPGFHKFWMKGMRFAIDVVWIGADWKIAGVSRNVLPESYPGAVLPPAKAQYVLELGAGLAAKYGLKPGDNVILKP